MPVTNYPDHAEVERISEFPDPIIRNLQITQCYFELARQVETRIPGNACWCTFATWASKQAGQTIRKEDLAQTLEHVLGTQQDAQEAYGELAAALEKLRARPRSGQKMDFLLKVLDPESAFVRSSEAVARGNLKVFAEIGRAFAVFNDTCLGDSAYQAAKIDSFCQQLDPGDPPDGQRYLRQAFIHYYRAFFEPDPKNQAELVLLANLEIGFHEQTRLQPEINTALAAPVIPPDDFVRNLLQAYHPDWGFLNLLLWLLIRLFGGMTGIHSAIQTYLSGAQREAQLIVTEGMMTIELPKGKFLRLGLDLDTPYPAELRHITNPELVEFLAGVDPVPDGTAESGARYWGDLPDRMHFIAELFRCFQRSPMLSESPFDVEQTAALKAGRLPDGRL